MLIITRKKNDSIIIDLGGEQIEILVTEIGKQVRLGITAPQGCKIWRKELYTTVRENRQAVGESSPENIREILHRFAHKNPLE